MKKKINFKPTLLFLFILIAMQALSQSNINVFNKPVNINAPVTAREYATGYPVSIGAEHLKVCEAKDVTTTSLTHIFDAVKIELDPSNWPQGIPVIGAFFTTQTDGNPASIKREWTHGFCFAFNHNNALTLYYYEKNDNGVFVPVDNLTTRINSYSENTFIAFHYSRFSPGTYPMVSTIFKFTCDTLGMVTKIDSSDIFIALSRDLKRQTGLYPLGMANSSILASCESPISQPSNCENDCNMTMENTHCLVETSNGQTHKSCASGLGHCAAGAIEKRTRDNGIDPGPIKFKAMRDFRDRFMVKYCEGRKYTGYYYAFSEYAKMDVGMLWKYVVLMPELYEAMENLSDESSDKVVITPSIRDKAIEILREHKDVGDSYFQSVLTEVEKDLEIFTGLRRSELVAMLSPYGSCQGGRNSGPDHLNQTYYFVTTYVNPTSEELVVNYSVPGNNVTLELYNVTAGLVSSESYSLAQQKLSKSTASMQPGIYFYRLYSDTGYKKVGKVVIAR